MSAVMPGTEMPTNPILRFDEGILALEGWSGHPGKSLGVKWVHQAETNRWVANAAQYREISKEGLTDLVPAWQQLEPLKEANLHKPRPAQAEAIANWKVSKYEMAWMPTGTGKTEVALHIVNDLNVSALIIAPTRDIMYQWSRRIEKGLGVKTGIIGDNFYSVRPISVATYHSACIHMTKLGNLFKLVIWDEVHHLPGDIRGDASRMCAAPYRLGLTATPPHFSAADRRRDRRFPGRVRDRRVSRRNDGRGAVRIRPPGETRFGFFYEKRKTKPRYSHENLSADAAHDRPYDKLKSSL